MDIDSIVNKIHDWNDHKKNSFDSVLIAKTLEELLKKGLIKETLYNSYQLNIKS